MLIAHANWTGGALHLWAESLDAFRDRAGGPGSARPDDAAAGGAATVVADLATAVATTASAHPFAARADTLRNVLGGVLRTAPGALDREASFRLRLPAADGEPLPSDRLHSVTGTKEREIAPSLDQFDVPSLALSGDTALATLLALGDGEPGERLELGFAIRYWAAVAQLVVELLADQRFVPTLVQTRGADLHAAWQPWLHDEPTRQRIGALVSAMPPVVRAAVDEHEGRPWPILDEALGAMTGATVRAILKQDDFADAIDDRDPALDPHVAWLDGLLHDNTRVVPPNGHGTEMLRDVRRWIAELEDRSREGALRLGLTLDAPDDGVADADDGDAVWRLHFSLVGAGSDPVRLDAEQVWGKAPAARALVPGGSPEELLLEELGRAARLYSALEDALSEAAPTLIELDTAGAYAFLSEHRELLEESGVDVQVPEWWGQPAAQIGARLQIEAPLGAGDAQGDSASTGGPSLLGLNSLVHYQWRVAVGDRTLTMEEFQAVARSARRGSLMRLHDNWVEIRPEQLADAAAFFAEHPGGEMTLLEAIQLAHGASGDHPGLPVTGLETTGWVSDLLDASSGETQMPKLEQPESFRGTLRPYQEVGLSWLAFLDRFGLGACLADDMGLGKTVQLIALLLQERADASRNVGPTLLIVPTSVVANWQREIDRFGPELRVHVQHGPDRPQGERLHEIVATNDVVITTYTLISRDRESLGRIPWYRVVLDEAQYIKNPPTKQTSTIRALDTTRRVALTGTPVENRLSELWSIMEFCNPGYLGQPAEFRRRFGVPIERQRDQHRAEQLRGLVRPFILRRLKTDPNVITDLPPCVTTKEYATLTPEQAGLYERTVSAMLGQVGKAEGIQRRGLVLATLVKLKQICNHPAQLPPPDGVTDVGVDGHGRVLSARSGKAHRLMQMLEEVIATGDRALLFTQFRRMGHLLSAMIQHDLDANVEFLHGGTPPPKRQKMIDRFQDPNGGMQVFILSLKAGGVGLNLTAANHVFHYDRWWNPAVENQATDRAFRIGQTRTVHVHKFVCLGTLEERIDQMIEQKSELAQHIIGAGEDWLTEMSTGQLREMLTLRQTAMDLEGGA